MILNSSISRAASLVGLTGITKDERTYGKSGILGLHSAKGTYGAPASLKSTTGFCFTPMGPECGHSYSCREASLSPACRPTCKAAYMQAWLPPKELMEDQLA